MIKKLSLTAILLITISACTSKTSTPSLKTVKKDPKETATIYTKLGINYIEKQEFDLARSRLLKAQALAPNSGEVHNALAYLYNKTADPAQAETHYKKALKLSRNAPQIQNDYAIFLCQQGQVEQSTELFIGAAKNAKFTRPEQAYENLAICLKKQGQLDEAKKYFQTALKKNSKRRQSALELTDIYLINKEYEKAHQTLQKYWSNNQQDIRSLELALDTAKGLGQEQLAQDYAVKLHRLRFETMKTAPKDQS